MSHKDDKQVNKPNEKMPDEAARKRELLKRLLEQERQSKNADKATDKGIVAKAKLCFKKRPADLQSLPLSFAQEALWFVDKVNPENAGYNTMLPILLKGELDLTALHQTLETLQQRHEVLRICFIETDNNIEEYAGLMPAQDDNINVTAVIHEKLDLPLTEIDFSQEDDAPGKLENVIKNEMVNPFDLSQAPLYRAVLIKMNDADHRLILTVHHIISDGWSTGVLYAEFCSIYQVYAAGQDISLPPAVQYLDYAIAQRDYLTKDVLEKQLAYWKHQLSDVPQLKLAKDHARSSINSYQGRSKIRMFPAVLSKAIRTLSQQQGVTVFVTMLSVFNLLMQRYSSQGDIVIGTPLMIRNTPELEKIVGMLINMAVLRMQVQPEISFKAFLKSNRKMMLDAHDNSDLPFDYLVKALQPLREANVNPFFQVVFAQDMAHSPVLHQGHTVDKLSIQVHGSIGASNNKVTRFDIEAYLKDSGEDLGIEFVCNKQMFDETTVDRMLDHYICLLEQAVKQPDAQISLYSLLNNDMRQKVLTQWNQTGSSYPRDKSVAELFEQQVQINPEAIAIVYKQQKLSYEGLNQRANQLAHYLIDCGLQSEDMVALCLERSVDLIVSILAITKAGGVYIPLDADYPEQRLAFMLDDIKAGILLTQSNLLDQLPEFSRQIICLDRHGPEIERYKTDNPDVVLSATNLIYVMYTSGSTGQPKGVCVEHRNVVRLVKETNYIEMGPAETFLLSAPVSFDASTMEIWGSLLNGASLVIYPDQQLSTDELAKVIEQHKVTTLFLTSALFNQMVDHHSQALSGIKQLLTGGEMLSAKHAKTMRQQLNDGRLIHVYGPTEGTTYSTYHVIKNDEEISNYTPIGKPISNTTAYVLDEKRNPVPPGITGELYVGGDGLARGYLNQPVLTNESFIYKAFNENEKIRLYRTGDLVRYTDDGDIVFIGRADHQIKLRGYRIELGEIETLLASFETVSEVLVMLREDVAGDKRLVAYLTLHNSAKQDASEIRRYCQNNLPVYMVPSAFVVLDSFPVSKNGKVDQKSLPEPDTGRQLNSTYIAAKGKLELAIADIWKEVLHLDEVGIEDNFFDLGGHSLLLVKVHKQIKQLLQKDIPIVNLFQHPTIRSLSAVLQADDVGDEISLIETIKNNYADNASNEFKNEPIAVIGLSGRFPGAGNIQQFWQNLKDGKESIKFFSAEELRAAGIDENIISHPDFVPAKGYLENADQFDAQFFGYSPRDADFMDPQQRLFLMLAWEALENANYDAARYGGKIGVFAGCSENSYWFSIKNNEETRNAGMLENALAAGKDFLASRVAYKLDLHGPAITLQTACSTSLVAIHEACRSIINGECDMAMAGGVSISAPLVSGYIYTPDSIASPDGHCRAFDASAAGTLGGDGGGIVVLKRLSQALKDGDIIHAVVRGSAINNDGALKVGYTAPSVEGQSEAIASAIVNSGVDVSSISYIETHGTGTNLGDPIEIAALKKVYSNVDPDNKILLGSLKTNVGHLDAAAGVSSFIKTVLSLENKIIPASLHYEKPNPELNLEDSPFQVIAKLSEWRQSSSPARAGISSFGIGGTNAHIILEQAPERNADNDLTGDIGEAVEVGKLSQLLILSAKNIAALNEMSANLASAIVNEKYSLNDVSYTLQSCRARFKYTRLIIADDETKAIEVLSETNSPFATDIIQDVTEQQVVFMFSGQGSQHVNMGRQLYNDPLCSVFRDTVDSCLQYLDDIDINLSDIVQFKDGAKTVDCEAEKRITETRYAQPALFIFEVALARQWMTWGVKPAAMIGHSIGEYAAACLAGVMSLQDALLLVAERGRLMHEMPAGSMLSVPLSRIDCDQQIKHSNITEELSIATINTPEMTVVSGEDAVIEKFQAFLLDHNIDTRKLHTSHAFHSHMMKPMLDAYRQVVAGVELKAPQIPYISNVSGTWITAEDATNPEYYSKHIRQAVNFSSGLATLFEIGNSVFIEVGPGQVLQTLASRHSEVPKSVTVVASSPRITAEKTPHDNDEINALLLALGRLYASGVNINWDVLHAATGRVNKVILPSYPFQMQRFWIEPSSQSVVSTKLARCADPEQWSYIPSWQRVTIRPDTLSLEDKLCWLVFNDNSGVSNQLAAKFEDQSDTVISVVAGDDFIKQDEKHYQINPQRLNDYEKLFSALKKSENLPDVISHCWMIDPPPFKQTADEADDVLEKGFYSLIYLYQTLHNQLPDHAVKIVMIGSQLQDVNGTESIIAEKCMAMAPLKVIPMENQSIQTRLIDIVLDDAVDNPRFIKQLTHDLKAQWQQPVIAYRGQYRWAQSFEQVPLVLSDRQSNDGQAFIVSGGNYVITGGLGQIGLELASALSSAAKVNLHIISRRQMPSQDLWQNWLSGHSDDDAVSKVLTRLLALESNGTRIFIHQADAADENAMQQIFAQIEDKSGRVNGVISCVGAAKQPLSMELLDETHCQQQFNSRIKSLKALEKVLQDRAVDFCVITSSLASVMGVMGFVSYTAAHQFIDAFVYQHNRSSDSQWLCINWDNWLSSEQSIESENESVSKPVTEFYIKADEGQRIFLESLRQKVYTHLFVSTGDLQARIDLWASIQETDDKNTEQAEQGFHGHPRPALATPYVAAETEPEKLLVAIWQQVLGLNEVGIHDNFFELGGDSVLNIQITSRARQVGIVLTPKQVFEFQTVHELANVAGGEKAVTAEQSAISGEVLLTPVQCWLFERQLPNVNHFNLPQMLRLNETPGAAVLEKAMRYLVNHHDVLRMRYAEQAGSWTQINDDVTDHFEIETIDVSAIDPVQQSTQIELISDEAQRTLDIISGPLFRVIYVNTGPQAKPVLILMAHHLIVDVVSWRILLEDIETCYLAVKNNEAPVLPQKTTSFKHWSSKLNEYAQSSQALSSLDYWKQLAKRQFISLPQDHNGDNSIASTQSIFVELDENETRTLLTSLPAKYDVGISDLLVYALTKAICNWMGNDVLLLNLEGHGREYLFDDVDISRTVGWFTSIYPVCFEVDKKHSAQQQLKAIQQQAKAVPLNGMAYGLLRYLNKAEEAAVVMKSLSPARISFLYMGQFDQSYAEGSLYSPALVSEGQPHDPLGTRGHVLEINSLVKFGKFIAGWSFSKNLHDIETIQTIANEFISELKNLVGEINVEAKSTTNEKFGDGLIVSEKENSAENKFTSDTISQDDLAEILRQKI